MNLEEGSCVLVDNLYIVKIRRIEGDRFWGPYVSIDGFSQVYINDGLFTNHGTNVKPIIEEVRYAAGRRFTIDGLEHILAEVGVHTYCFIGLISGNRWRSPVTFRPSRNGLTLAQLKQIGNDSLKPI